jgi:hypothetical protein
MVSCVGSASSPGPHHASADRMNYFAHGRDHLADAYFLAGTCVPDWLSVVDRRVRVRSKSAASFVAHDDVRLAAVARGVQQHFFDDRWFHGTRAFTELSWELTVAARAALPDDDGFRPSFLGHILVEILLDAALIEAAPQRLEEYYAALAQADPLAVQKYVGLLAGQPVPLLAPFISGFCAERFLYDYREDAKLLARLNRVMQRVGLSQLPDAFVGVLRSARRMVERSCAAIMTPEPGQDTPRAGTPSIIETSGDES